MVEHPELVAERIVRLAKLVGRDNVIAGTDCGFAQGPFVQRVHPSIMWAKLRALVEGARPRVESSMAAPGGSPAQDARPEENSAARPREGGDSDLCATAPGFPPSLE